jgi:glycine C-acetyltransferase
MMNDTLLAPSEHPELTALALDFMQTEGTDLLGRWRRLGRFWDARLAARLDPHFRVAVDQPRPECGVLTRSRERLNGVNFAAQDYLSLAYHPALRQAAIEAVGRWGVHTTGSIAEQGGSVPLLLLEERLVDFLCCSEVATFPTGWAAGYTAVRALVRELDHVVIDPLAHDCLQEGAVSATHNVHRVLHGSHDALCKRLGQIRSSSATAGILVATQSLFPLDSSVPDLRAIRDVCRAYKATLLVNVSHDLGAIGQGGLGFVGEQGMVGEADVIVGSFSKTFGSNGGFVASRDVGLKQALRTLPGPYLCSNALSPVQASIVIAALEVIRSREGAQRRHQLAANVQRLREGLKVHGFRILGRSSAIVPVWLGNVAEARVITRSALANGGLVTLTEHPVVSRTSSRWRLQVMADHSAEQIDRFIEVAVSARQEVASTSGPWSAGPHFGCDSMRS